MIADKRWPGSTVVCIASGPSLSDEQLQVIEHEHASGRWKVIAVNDNYSRAPWADVVYAGDCQWWNVHHANVKKQAPGTELWTCDNVAAARYRINRVRGANRPGLGSWQIHTGGNSGYQAINLAYLWGASRILLVGYDMQPTGGQAHWFGQHAAPLVQKQLFTEWCHRYQALAEDLQKKGVEVINCTRQSALIWFPRASIEDFQA